MSQELKPCESCAAPKHQHYPQRNGDSICAACGATYGLATAPVPPAGEWEKLAKHLAYYLPSALVSHQHMMTPETLSDALEALHKVRNMPALPAVSGVGRMPERLTSDDDRVPNMHSLQKVAWCSGYGHAIDACTPIVTRLQAENAARDQRIAELEAALRDISNWLVCYAIATPEDVCQNIPAVLENIETLLSKGGRHD